MTTCHSVDEVRAAALADAAGDAPLSQDQADEIAAILAPHQDRRDAA